MNKVAGYVLLVSLLAGCQSEKPGQASAHQPETVADSAQFVTDSTNVVEEAQQERQRLAEVEANAAVQEADTSITVRFRELTLSVSPMHPDEDTPRTTPLLNADSLTIGQNQYTQGGLRLTVDTSTLTNIHISERVGVVLTASRDDMTYTVDETLRYTPWRPLRRVGRHQFTGNAYTELELIHALNLSLSRIKRLVKQHGDSLAYATIRPMRSLTGLKTADHTAVAYYCLRITGRRKGTKQVVVKYILVENQIGC